MKIAAKPIDYKKVVEAIQKGETISIDTAILQKLKQQREKIKKLIIDKEIPTYGVNTGFGALRTKSIPKENISELQENLILSHAVGVGKPLDNKIVKAIMLLITISLSKGFSGVRPIIVETLLEMINKNVIPIVPEKGSVGSSGDLAPSAHIMLVLIGQGEAYYKGKRIKGNEAMKLAGITPVKLEAKEGLALINNTATMTANAIFALTRAQYLANVADIAGALSAEALRATTNAFDERVHSIKPHQGQIEVAKNLRNLLKGSTMRDEKRIQDQYSIRCMPQVHGAIRETMTYADKIVSTEVNSVTDNPLIFSKGDSIEAISAGNFHGEAVAIAMDSLKLAICEFGNISDRRVASLLDANHNFGLPSFLATNPGLNSGMMILQYTTAALVSENKVLAHPASVDSIPTSSNFEDFVSMGTIAARKTLEVVENVENVLAIELLVACQAIDFRLKKGYKLGHETEKIYEKIRKVVPFFAKDQEYISFVGKISEMIEKQIL